MRDGRLLGAWKSDRRRTLREIRPCSDLSEGMRDFYERIFGKLVLTYRPSTCVSEGIGERRRARYEVVATDSHSVVIRTVESLTNLETLRHLHFEGKDRYWV